MILICVSVRDGSVSVCDSALCECEKLPCVSVRPDLCECESALCACALCPASVCGSDSPSQPPLAHIPPQEPACHAGSARASAISLE